MILFQLGIFAVIIIASFFGILPLIGALIFIALFTLANVFTLPLMFIQFHTIAFSAVIGFIIALIVDIRKGARHMHGSIGRLIYSLKTIFSSSGFKYYLKNMKGVFFLYIIYLFTNFSKVALIITLIYLLWSIQDIKYYDKDASYISYGLVTFIIFYLMKKIFIVIALGQAYFI